MQKKPLIKFSTHFGEGNGNPLHYSCLENPMDRGAWRATVCGIVKSRTRLNNTTTTTTVVGGAALERTGREISAIWTRNWTRRRQPCEIWGKRMPGKGNSKNKGTKEGPSEGQSSWGHRRGLGRERGQNERPLSRGPHQLLAGVQFLYKVWWEEFELGKWHDLVIV